MSATMTLLNIIGGVCLLLFGVNMVRKGITRAFGESLRRAIAKSTSNRFKAFFVGLGVTTVLQSSTATALVVSSFTARGFVSGGMAIAVILGADVGTTIVAQVLSLDIRWLSPLFLLSGYITYKSSARGSRGYNLGRAAIGLGLMLLSLQIVMQSSEPIRQSEAVAALLTSLSHEPFLAVTVAAVLTWLAHSSLAMVLLFMSFVATGAVSVPLGLTFVLGANIGGAIGPFVMTLKSEPAAVRVTFANLIMRVVGVLAVLPALPWLLPYGDLLSTDAARQIVNFHTCFNIGMAIMFLPLITYVGRITEKVFPEKESDDQTTRPRYLDASALDTPAAALSCAARETLRISDTVERMLRNTLEVFRRNDYRLMNEIREQDDIVDTLYDAVKTYMAKLSGEELNESESRRYIQILTFSTNLEHIGDAIDVNLMELASKKIRSQSHFSEDGFQEIAELHQHIMENLQLSQNVFMSEDLNMARRLVQEKARVRDHEISASASHLERLREGVAETIATSSLHLDILRDFRRINSYLTAIAYPILENAGELHKSRLKGKRRKPQG